MSLEDSLYPLLRMYENAPQRLKSLIGGAYSLVPKRLKYGRAYNDFIQLCHLEDEEGISEGSSYVLEALKSVAHSALDCPFYRNKLSNVDIHLISSPVELLSHFPLLSKNEMLERGEELVSLSAKPQDKMKMTSGGSTGEPVGFYLQKGISRPKEQAFLEAQWRRFGYMPGHRVAIIRGTVVDARSQGNISSYDAARGWLTLSSYHITLERVAEYVAELNSFKPKHIHAYPSSALMLAQCMEEAGLKLDFQPLSLLCGSEKLTVPARRYLERFFQAPICHWYGHSERAVFAGCKQGDDRLFPWRTYGYMEFGPVDDEGMREIIATGFHNQVMPLIRYCTGDRARVEETPDGPVILEIAGRTHEFLVSGTGRRVSLTAINMHDDIFEGLRGVQFFQEEKGVVELRYVPSLDWHQSREHVVHAGVMAKLGDDFSLTLSACESLEKTAAGKHKWLVTNLISGSRMDLVL
jgi:phenylacetate-CoA ligase